MKGLTILTPMAITVAMLTACDVAETEYAAYAAGTTYALGDRRIYNHAIYQSLAAGNLGNTPDTSPTKWVFVSATNRWKLFDQVNSSQTAQSTSMSYTVRPGGVVTAISAINLKSVNSIRVRMVSDAYGLVYDKTVTRTSLPASADWWEWFFGARTESLSTYYGDLPSFLDAAITIDFTGLTDMAVGTLLLGTTSTWGMTLVNGVSMGIRDYSKKETNEWGDIVLTKRNYSKKARFPLALEGSQVDALYAFLAGIRATPCLWLGSDQYACTVVYGYYTDFEILISYAAVSDCTLTLEGLT